MWMLCMLRELASEVYLYKRYRLLFGIVSSTRGKKKILHF